MGQFHVRQNKDVDVVSNVHLHVIYLKLPHAFFEGSTASGSPQLSLSLQ